jgi:cytochrome P450
MEQRLLPRLAGDMRREVRVRRRGVRWPAGSTGASWANTRDAIADPLRMLLDHERRYGPVFTIRVLHDPVVWAIGAEANHQILVSEFDAFHWREGRFADLWWLLGDGLLNIDGAYHREFRMLLLPAFHRESVAAVAETMIVAAARAGDALRDGQTLDVYRWTRQLAMRIALRALIGLEAADDRERSLAEAFEESLSIHGRPVVQQLLRGPFTPYARAHAARRTVDALVQEEIHERRRRGDPGRGVLGLLLAATDDAGEPLDAGAVRDQAVTLLFAGHDTTTATFTFMLHEVGRSAQARADLEAELDGLLADRLPTAADLDGRALPVLERTLSETLRCYPPAWVGPRQTTRDVTLAGVEVPAEVGVHYSSWATHHLESLYPEPFRFDPNRFLPENDASRPRGAYIPFGGGSRMCIGKRFGEYELRALAAVLLSRWRFEPVSTADPQIATTPTLGPKHGLKFVVRRRSPA